jgi:hypothetical protein
MTEFDSRGRVRRRVGGFLEAQHAVVARIGDEYGFKWIDRNGLWNIERGRVRRHTAICLIGIEHACLAEHKIGDYVTRMSRRCRAAGWNRLQVNQHAIVGRVGSVEIVVSVNGESAHSAQAKCVDRGGPVITSAGGEIGAGIVFTEHDISRLRQPSAEGEGIAELEDARVLVVDQIEIIAAVDRYSLRSASAGLRRRTPDSALYGRQIRLAQYLGRGLVHRHTGGERCRVSDCATMSRICDPQVL